MLTGQNGILNRASEAKEKTESANIDEQRKLAQAEALMNTEKTTYKGVTLPEGFAPTKIDGEDSIDNGLVITDGYGNEYVGVEVPKTETVYPTATINIAEFDENAYAKVEDDLHTYTEAYRNNTNYNDTYAKDTAEGWFKDADEYNEAKQRMLKSVYQNEGFWVGRYEAGIENEANIRKFSSNTAKLTPVTKQNMYPYTYVTRTQAKVLAEQVESGSYISSLMFGVQWDLVLKYIETKGAATNFNLASNSTTIGNYNNNLWNITNAKYSIDDGKKFTECPYEKKSNANVLLTTGADRSFSLMNIYDIAGNVSEWTLEKTSHDSYLGTNRGGNYDIDGLSNPASYRNGNDTLHSGNNIGFRISLY